MVFVSAMLPEGGTVLDVLPISLVGFITWQLGPRYRLFWWWQRRTLCNDCDDQTWAFTKKHYDVTWNTLYSFSSIPSERERVTEGSFAIDPKDLHQTVEGQRSTAEMAGYGGRQYRSTGRDTRFRPHGATYYLTATRGNSEQYCRQGSDANDHRIACSDTYDGPVRGNRRSMIYHWPGCPNYDDIADQNRVPFPTAVAAEEAGYRAARNCP